MSEIQKNNDVIDQKENPAEELKNISNLENLVKNFDKKETAECCWKLNNIFHSLFENWQTKDWQKYDFTAALKAKVPNPIWFEA